MTREPEAGSSPSERHGPSTLGVHAGGADRTPGAPVVPAVVQSATFHWSTPDDGDLLYSRYGNNPNQVQAGAKIAALEGTEAAAVLGSGMAAAAMTLLSLTEAGDHIVASSQLYGATQSLLREELPRRGVETTFVDPGSGAWEHAMRPETRVVYLELPTNPTLRVPDPRPIVALAHARGATVACDATFASPVNLRAAELGIDAVIHSATKYLGGHSDIVAGVVAGSDALVRGAVGMSRLYGPAIDPHSAWLLDRGLRTLEIRMQRHNANGIAVAEWLTGQEQVERVVYPGLASHPDHAVATQIMSGFGGMVAFVLRGGGPAADRFVAALRLALPAPSLGGVETLVSQPRYTSHVGLSRREREAQGIPDGFVRLSVGIENAEDLVADFEQALRAAG